MRRFARLKRPVYITETGIADKADTLRGEWAESYFRAVRPSSLHLAACTHVLAVWIKTSKAPCPTIILCSQLGHPMHQAIHKDSTVIGQVEHAVADGYDVRGLMYWTLVDNFEVGLPLPTGVKLSTLAPHEMRNHQGYCND